MAIFLFILKDLVNPVDLPYRSGLKRLRRFPGLLVYSMPQDVTIHIRIDPSLLDHVRDHLASKGYDLSPQSVITNLATTILDNSPYPIRAKQTGEREIHIRYQIRSFSQPIFD